MKIVFIKDIPKVGKKNEVKEVANGYATFLIKSGAAAIVSTEILTKISQEKLRNDSLKQKTVDEFKLISEKLKDKRFTIKAKVNGAKNLFGAVHEEDIKNIIHSETGLLLNPKSIKISSAIKQIGIHHIAVTEGTMHVALEIEVLAS